MSDSDPSGAATAAAETASAPSTRPAPAALPGPFSNNRGSGLARGKRSASPAPQAAGPAVEYKPTAVAIVAAPTEYKNPFAPPAPVSAPVEVAPVQAAPSTPMPAPATATVAPAIPAAEAAKAPAVPVAVSQPRTIESGPPQPATGESKPELKILPPETPKRVEQSWESQSFRNVASQPGGESVRPAEPQSQGQRPRREDGRDDRQYFRSERDRRNDRPYEQRTPRDATSAEQVPASDQPRGESAPAPAEAKKPGGMFAWVKKIFGGSPPETPKTEAQPGTSGQREFNPEGPYRRRRHRGGRNRNFQGDQRGPRDGQQGGQPSGDQRGYRGEQRGYRGEQRGYRGDQRNYDGQNRGQGNRRRGPEGGNGGYRGQGRPEGGPPAGGS